MMPRSCGIFFSICALLLALGPGSARAQDDGEPVAVAGSGDDNAAVAAGARFDLSPELKARTDGDRASDENENRAAAAQEKFRHGCNPGAATLTGGGCFGIGAGATPSPGLAHRQAAPGENAGGFFAGVLDLFKKAKAKVVAAITNALGGATTSS